MNQRSRIAASVVRPEPRGFSAGPFTLLLPQVEVAHFRVSHHYAFMKKFAILGFLALAITAILLWQWFYHPSDDQIPRRIVGGWSFDSDPKKAIEHRADGNVVVKSSGIETDRGTWQVKNGYIINSAPKGSSHISNFQMESNKVLRILGDKMVVLSMDGHTEVTLHRP